MHSELARRYIFSIHFKGIHYLREPLQWRHAYHLKTCFNVSMTGSPLCGFKWHGRVVSDQYPCVASCAYDTWRGRLKPLYSYSIATHATVYCICQFGTSERRYRPPALTCCDFRGRVTCPPPPLAMSGPSAPSAVSCPLRSHTLRNKIATTFERRRCSQADVCTYGVHLSLYSFVMVSMPPLRATAM